MQIISKGISKIAIGFSLVLMIIHFVYFNENINSIIWNIIGILVFIWFFTVLPKHELYLKGLDESLFVKKLFWFGLLIRFFFMVLIHLETLYLVGHEQYVGAQDAQGYEYWARILVDEILSGNFNIFQYTYINIAEGSYDDTGFYIIMTFLHLLAFNITFIVKILLIAINSYMSIIIYRISKFYFDGEISKFAGILAMLFPLSFFFGSVYLKESILTFIVVSSVYITLKLIYEKFRLTRLLLLILLLIIPFTLRTAVAVTLLATIGMSVLFSRSPFFKSKQKTIFFVSVATLLVVFFVYNFLSSSFYTQMVLSGDETALAKLNRISSKISLFNLASTPLFISLALFAPFPNIVFIPNDLGLPHVPDDYLTGGLMVKSVLSVFIILGLMKLVYTRFRNYIFLWFFPLLYLLVLAISGYFTSERMQYTAMPLLLIFASYGMHSKELKKYWIPLLILSGVLVFAWNFFRLKSRGII